MNDKPHLKPIEDEQRVCVICKKPNAEIIAPDSENNLLRWHANCRKNYLAWLDGNYYQKR